MACGRLRPQALSSSSGGRVAGLWRARPMWKKLLENLFHTRRMFGGGIPHAWPMTALALHHADGFEARYAKAAEVSRELFAELCIRKSPAGSHIGWLKTKDALGLRKKLSAQIPLFVHQSGAKQWRGKRWPFSLSLFIIFRLASTVKLSLYSTLPEMPGRCIETAVSKVMFSYFSQ